MVYKISMKKLSDQVDQILSRTYVGGKKRTSKLKKSKTSKNKISKNKTSKKRNSKKLARFGQAVPDEVEPYIANLSNIRRMSRNKKKSKSKTKSKKLKRGLPPKLIEFGRLRDEVSKIINKKGKIAMQVAKVVKDDVQKTVSNDEIENNYKAFINKVIDHLKKNSSHYIKVANDFSK